MSIAYEPMWKSLGPKCVSVCRGSVFFFLVQWILCAIIFSTLDLFRQLFDLIVHCNWCWFDFCVQSIAVHMTCSCNTDLRNRIVWAIDLFRDYSLWKWKSLQMIFAAIDFSRSRLLCNHISSHANCFATDLSCHRLCCPRFFLILLYLQPI